MRDKSRSSGDKNGSRERDGSGERNGSRERERQGGGRSSWHDSRPSLNPKRKTLNVKP